MGVVYSAYDEELDRKLAIKVLRKELKDKGHAPLRIHREAQALARLNHPNVVQVYDVGSLEGQLYIAMEYVDGVSLKQWVSESGQDWRDCLNMFIEAGHGLAAAHAAGLIHRDFKPDNVLVGHADSRPRVLDFGLARPQDVPETLPLANDSAVLSQLVDTGPSLSDPLTRHGSLIGTPAYMSPEQHIRQPADARSDQFSFCVALHEALYGVRPFPGGTQKEVAHAILRGRIRPPPEDSRVPQWIRRILLRGLEADPDARWPTMASLLSALANDPTRKRKRVIAGLLLTAIAAFGAYALAVSQSDSAPDMRCSGAQAKLEGVWGPEQDELVGRQFLAASVPYAEETWSRVSRRLTQYSHEWVQLHEDACRATNIRQEQSQAMLDLQMACLSRNLVDLASLTELLQTADENVVEHAVSSAAALRPNALCTDLARLHAQRQLPVATADQSAVAAVRKKLAQAHVRQQSALFELALKLAQDAETAARELGYPGPIAEATLQHGQILQDLGKFAEAEEKLLDAYWTAEAAHDDVQKIVTATTMIKLVGVRLARLDGGQQWARATKATLDRLDDRGLNRARFLDATGALEFEAGNRANALALHLEARTILTRELRSDDPELAWSLNNLGIVYQAQGELDEAVRHFDEAITSLTDSLGNSHPDLGIPLNNLGNALVTQGKVSEARTAFERVLDLRTKVFGPNHPSLGYSLNALGNVFQKQGELDRALSLFERADDIWQTAYGDEHPNLGYTSINLASVLLEQKKFDEARALFERAEKIWAGTYGPKHVTLGYPLEGLGQVALQRGDLPLAISQFERALALRSAAQAPPDEVAASAQSLAAALHQHAPQNPRVLGLYQQALARYREAGPGFESSVKDVEAAIAALDPASP